MQPRNVYELADIEAIRQLKARYCLVVDRKDWKGLRGLLVEDAVLAYGDEPHVLEVRGADDVVEALRRVIPDCPTAHYVHVPVFEHLDHENAIVVWSSEWLQAHRMHGFGFYRDQYRKGNDGVWRISTLFFETTWVEASFIPPHYAPEKVYLIPPAERASLGDDTAARAESSTNGRR